MSILLAVLNFFVWSSVFSLSKIAVQLSSVIFFISIRLILSGSILLVYAFIRYKKACFTTLKENVLVISLFGLLTYYFANIFENWGLRSLTSSKACFIYSLTPFFSALLSYIHLKEQMTVKKWIGLLIGFLGFLPILSLQPGQTSIFRSNFFLISLPDLAVLLATFLSSYGWVILKVLTHKKKHLKISIITGFSMLISGIVASIHALCTNEFIKNGADPYLFIKIVFILTITSNIICTNIYGILLKKHSATFLSLIGILSVFFSSIHGYIFLGEKPSSILFISSFVIALGIWLFHKSEKEQKILLETIS